VVVSLVKEEREAARAVVKRVEKEAKEGRAWVRKACAPRPLFQRLLKSKKSLLRLTLAQRYCQAKIKSCHLDREKER